MTNRYLSAKEVAGLLGIAESTAYAVIRGWNKELRKEVLWIERSTIDELSNLICHTRSQSGCGDYKKER